MEYRLRQEKLYELVAPVVEGLGFRIADLRSHIVQSQLHINLVLYSPEGVTIDDCADVYRTALARLEMAEDNRDIHLEVSSPGLGRVLKSAEELEVFSGRGVQILPMDGEEWISGILGPVNNHILDLLEKDEAGQLKVKAAVPVHNIRKAKLDDTVEIGR